MSETGIPNKESVEELKFRLIQRGLISEIMHEANTIKLRLDQATSDQLKYFNSNMAYVLSGYERMIELWTELAKYK